MDINLKKGLLELKPIVRKKRQKRIELHTTLPEYQIQWLKEQDKPMSKLIEKALNIAYRINAE